MRFRSVTDLDTSQISDRRGRGGPVLAGGGGLIGLVVVLFSIFTGTDLTGLTDQNDPVEQAGQTRNLAAECQTGVDANEQADCRIVGVVNSVQEYWKTNLRGYTEAQTVFFSGATTTGCGQASSAIGPFYCPADQTVYIDLSFYDQLRSDFGASGGPFAEAYVIAHEYGHHIEEITGVLDRANSRATGSTSASVRTELMADCLAGMWARGAEQTRFIEDLTEQDISDGLSAAAAVGDDRIQQRSQGSVDKESWTHGSSEQRQRWFMTGYNASSIRGCDTFAATSL